MKKSLRIISVLLSLFVMLTLSGCSVDKEAEERLSSMLDTLTEGNYFDAITEYTLKTEGSYDFLQCLDNFNEEDFPAYNMHLAVFESLSYDIKKASKSDETQIHLLTEIETIDLTPVGKELANTTAAYNITAQNGEDDERLSDTELNDLLTQQMVNISNEYLEGSDVKTRKTEVEVILCYDVATGWMVYIDEALADALSGGVYTAFYTEMSNANMVTK